MPENSRFTPGVLPSPADHRDWLYAGIAKAISLPTKHRCRITPLPVRDQGAKGTCYGHAASCVNEIFQYIENGAAERLSPLYVYSMAKQLDGYPDIEGTFGRAVMKVLTQYGDCPETTMPYSAAWTTPPLPDEEQHRLARPNRFAAYAKVSTEQELKQALVEQGPLPIAMMLTDNIYEAQNGVWPAECMGTILGGHAMTLIGYDDTLKLYEVINSWGINPGLTDSSGHCFIPYARMHKESLASDLPIPSLLDAWSMVDMLTLKLSGNITVSGNRVTILYKGQPVDMEIEPFIVEDINRAFFPVRELEKFGHSVVWNGNNYTILVD